MKTLRHTELFLGLSRKGASLLQLQEASFSKHFCYFAPKKEKSEADLRIRPPK